MCHDSSIIRVIAHSGAPIAQLEVCQTLDRKVAGSILTWGRVLCP